MPIMARGYFFIIIFLVILIALLKTLCINEIPPISISGFFISLVEPILDGIRIKNLLDIIYLLI